jgi:succinyl-diaminopimelate desuccinylase
VLSDTERRAVEAVDELFDEELAFAQALVRIPTINPPGAYYADCAELVRRHLADLGYTVEVLPAEGMPEHTLDYPRLNALARLPLGSGVGPTLHYNGHVDVVPPGTGWNVDPFGARVEDGRLYGRGTSDQKAGIAASIYAVEAIRRSGIPIDGTVEQSTTVDEESGGFAGVAWLCDQGLINRSRQDFVVMTEPLDPERIGIGHRGVYWFEISTLGRVGHGGMPGLAIDAVHHMARVLQAVDARLRPRLAARRTRAPVEPPSARQPTVTVNALHGGQALDALQTPCVPDRCTAIFDRRFLHEEPFDDVRGEIVELLERLRLQDDRFRYELRDLMRVDPLLGDPDGALAQATAGAIEDVLDRRAAFIASPGTFDQKHVVRRAGIDECVGYGPGRLTLAHQPDEHITLVDLRAGTCVLAVLTLRLLGAGSGKEND